MLNDSQRKGRELAIYAAVLRLIAAGRAPGALTVREIADAADIGKGTVYEYFPSKEAILQGLNAHCIGTELGRLEAAAAPCQTLAGLIDALLDYLADLARDRAGIYRVLAQSLGRPGPADGHCAPPGFAGRLQALLQRTLDRLRAAGEVDPALPEAYCNYTLAAATVSCLMLLTAADRAGAAPDGTPVCAPLPAHTVLQSTRTLLWRALCPPGCGHGPA